MEEIAMQWTLEHKPCPLMADILCYSNDCWEDCHVPFNPRRTIPEAWSKRITKCNELAMDITEVQHKYLDDLDYHAVFVRLLGQYAKIACVIPITANAKYLEQLKNNLSGEIDRLEERQNILWEDDDSNEMFTEACLRYIRLRMQKEILFGGE